MQQTGPNDTSALWIFGYGSLIWEPGFAHSGRQLARLDGFSRSFCMRSIHHRGTVAAPGLVLALDIGGSCDGVAFEVPARIAAETLEYLRARELISAAYLEQVLPVSLADGRVVPAVTYVVDRAHVQYCGGLPLSEQAQIIARAAGGRGANRDYLFNTTAHLDELGIADADLQWLSVQVRDICARSR
jgi:glutathione-specific gamma-glutamylcyclotransferase